MNPEFLAREKREKTEADFLSEYYCVFHDANDQLLATDDIDAAFSPHVDTLESITAPVTRFDSLRTAAVPALLVEPQACIHREEPDDDGDQRLDQPRPQLAPSGVFLITYACGRILVEFWRLPDVQIGYLYGGWLTMGHVLTAPMLLGGIALLVLAYRRAQPSGNLSPSG